MNGLVLSISVDTSLKEPLEANMTAWTERISQICPQFLIELKKVGFWKPEILEAVSDLDAHSLETHLKEVLSRAVMDFEVKWFQEMVNIAHSYAGAKRRRTLTNLQHPELDFAFKPQPVLTEREMPLAKIPTRKAAGTEFPIARGIQRKSKEGIRVKLVEALTAAIIECAMPTATLFATSTDPGRLFVRMGAGKRTSTLRQRLAVYKKMRSYMLMAYGITFPNSAIQLMDYLMDRSEEPCGVTVPMSILSTVKFFEEIGGRQEMKLHDQPILKHLCDELRVELATDRPKKLRKAHMIHWVFLALWELEIANKEVPEWKKILCWTQLVQTWGALRTSDTASTPPRRMTLDADGLSAVVTASKTTGKGKKIHEINFYVSAGAYLLHQDWLKEGWELFQKVATDRDFLLPMLGGDGTGFSTKEPAYVDGMNTTRKLIADLKTVRTVEDELGGVAISFSDQSLIPPGLQIFWTGHSARATVPSLAAYCAVPKETVDRMGRWKPSESSEYVRVNRKLICKAQDKIANSIRAGKLEEGFLTELEKEFSSFAAGRGLSEEDCWRMLNKLRGTQELLEQAMRDNQQGEASEISDIDDDEVNNPPADPVNPRSKVKEGDWVVSRKRNGKALTLHQVGRCWRIPGKHYARFETLDQSEVDLAAPENPKFDKVCQDCFKPASASTSDEDMSSEQNSDACSDSSESDSN